jgi:hypothetical protein
MAVVRALTAVSRATSSSRRASTLPSAVFGVASGAPLRRRGLRAQRRSCCPAELAAGAVAYGSGDLADAVPVPAQEPREVQTVEFSAFDAEGGDATSRTDVLGANFQ